MPWQRLADYHVIFQMVVRMFILHPAAHWQSIRQAMTQGMQCLWMRMAACQRLYLRQMPGASDRLTEYMKSMCNPNLLINADFTNPVNQRGKSNYNSYGYTIDMW